MKHRTPGINRIFDIIKVLKSGIKFYQDSIAKLNDPKTKSFFNRMIVEKKEAVNALQPFVLTEQGVEETQGEIGIKVRNMYTKVLGALSSKKEQPYLEQLEEVEDKVLDSIDEALDVDQPPRCAAELRRIRTRMLQCFDEMKTLQSMPV
ncbi:ferritin-like domain-containing protein [Alteromonas sp. ASW11-130]|uniref:ferritin-like domain-containing protein n=1 Tax=Alteromonas sp. ASW11-130 TaxID=3015775 RepID=UPI0022424735|nr:PA2169 family four-helix-bundle protein [Alteromonas sp. ASW11-130]